jgi:hypothetical protein
MRCRSGKRIPSRLELSLTLECFEAALAYFFGGKGVHNGESTTTDGRSRQRFVLSKTRARRACQLFLCLADTWAATYSEDVPFEFVYFRFAISFLPCVHRIASLADAVNVAAFFLTNSCTLIGPCPVSVSTLSDSRS